VLVRHPDSHFVTPHARYFQDGTNESKGTYNALPFDRKACLLTNRFGDAGAFFRRSMFVDHGLRYDPIPTGYEDWALWMDLHGRGIAGERAPRELYDYRVRADSMVRVDSAPNHPALVGWLIQHHLPNATQAERDLLTTLFQHAGQSIARVAAGAPDHLPPQPQPPPPKPASSNHVAKPAPAPTPPPPQPTPPAEPRAAAAEPPRPPLRHKVVDELSRWSHKIPGINRALRSLLGATFGRKRRNHRS
jgi:hypothetical protein